MVKKQAKSKVKSVMSYRPTRRNFDDEKKRLNTDITQMTTPEIIGHLYEKHQTGIWQSIAVLAIVAAISSIVL